MHQPDECERARNRNLVLLYFIVQKQYCVRILKTDLTVFTFFGHLKFLNCQGIFVFTTYRLIKT
jgi:hypothetical protein